jgi:hypothetical protein
MTAELETLIDAVDAAEAAYNAARRAHDYDARQFADAALINAESALADYVRTAAKRDLAEPAIIEALTACGLVVTQLSAKGVPDLLVFDPRRIGFSKDRWQLIEVKTGNGKLTDDEKAWWARQGIEPIIARTPSEALACFGIEVDT